MNSTKHKVFISYHHENDEFYKEEFIRKFGNLFIDYSVDTSSIDDTHLKIDTIRQKIRDDYIRDASVILVLIGSETWRRKHVDWEIASGIRKTKFNSRCGLLGIVVPNAILPTIPPRLQDNVNCGYAKKYNWSNDANSVARWIDEAFSNKDRVDPDNSSNMFGRNH